MQPMYGYNGEFYKTENIIPSELNKNHHSEHLFCLNSQTEGGDCFTVTHINGVVYTEFYSKNAKNKEINENKIRI